MAAKKINSAPENFDAYTNFITSIPGIEIKGATMPYTSLNGNMFSFLKEGTVALRLPKEQREQFLEKYRSTLFEAYGTVMTEYVTVPEKLLKKTNDKDIRSFLIASFEYAKTLKSKATKKINIKPIL